MARIIVSKDLLEQLRKEIAEHGNAVLADAGGDNEIAIQAAEGSIEPEDDEEMQIVIEAVREHGSDAPWLTSEQVRERLRRGTSDE